MKSPTWNPALMAIRLLFMAGVSALFIGLLLRLVAEPADAERAGVVDMFRTMSYGYVGVYLLLAFVQVVARASRYQVFLRAGGEGVVPSLVALCKITLVRNMVVDLFPARLGELFYVGLLRQVCGVSVGGGMTSAGFSLLFDVISLWILVMGLAVVQGIGGGMSATILQLLVGLGVLSGVAWWGVFFGMPVVVKVVGWMNRKRQGRLMGGLMGWALEIVTDAAREVGRIRTAGITLHALALSLIVRLCKYTGYYFCFVAVTAVLMSALAQAGPWRVVMASVVSEAAASVPVPTFMGFGLYEAGGTAAWVAFGFPKAEALVAVLAAHIVSQVVDYTLGGIGMLMVWWGMPAGTATSTARPRVGRRLVVAVILLGLVAAFAGFEWRRVTTRGALQPPEPGVTVAESLDLSNSEGIKDFKGIVVWSSNRGGNHDLYEVRLPGGDVRQLTTDRHVDTFPAISPDGRYIAFARSQQEWVSQRNMAAWDVWLLERESGRERRLAVCGREPRWVDERRLVFARSGTRILEYDLVSAKEREWVRSGQGDVAENLQLSGPSLNPRNQQLAVTVRGGIRATAVLDEAARMTRIAGGCQLAWQPGVDALVWVDQVGGLLKNAFYVKERGENRLLLDMPLPYSHEYFPKFTQDRQWLVFAASTGGHEHDTADYEIFLWRVGAAADSAVRLTCYTGNDCWPDIRLEK